MTSQNELKLIATLGRWRSSLSVRTARYAKGRPITELFWLSGPFTGHRPAQDTLYWDLQGTVPPA